MRILKVLLCGLVLAVPVFANETDDRKTATSLKYVAHELDTRQNKLETGTNQAITYTNAAGGVVQRTVKSDLNNGSTSDTSLPTVGAVTDGLSHKQDEIEPTNDHTAITYTGQTGSIGAKGIYQDSGTYAEQSDNLIDAKTFNAALKNGLDSEFVCDETNKQPGTGTCWLWKIHTNTLPDGYTRLAYIESTGTQYIDTRYLYNVNANTIKYVLDLSLGPENATGISNRKIIGTYSDNSFRPMTLGLYTNREIRLSAGDLTFGESSVKTTYSDNVRFGITTTINHNNKQISLTKDTTLDGHYSTYTRLGGNVYLFTYNNTATIPDSYKIYAKLYSAKIYEDSVLVRNFIPARHDNAIGMYDTVSGTFFENAGTGTFIPGPPVSSNIYIPQNQQ